MSGSRPIDGTVRERYLRDGVVHVPDAFDTDWLELLGRIRHRGDRAKAERAQFEAAGYREGDAIAGDFFPQLWHR